MSGFTYLAKSEVDTDRFGSRLADLLPAGTVVALIGTLGAGKTRLVQSVAEALGTPREEVTSPTFVLVQEYRSGRLPLFHFDAYRLENEDEFLQLGPEEYFDMAGLTFVEWADRVERCLPRAHLRVQIEVVGETQRLFTITPNSPSLEALLDRI